VRPCSGRSSLFDRLCPAALIWIPVLSFWTYSLIPLAALALGALAAAATEILPDLKHEEPRRRGILEILLMFGVKQAGERAKGSFGSVVVTAFGLLVDGLVLGGFGFSAGAKRDSSLRLRLRSRCCSWA